MTARRCSMGCENWPNTEKYATCPLCDEPTRRVSSATPLSTEEAHSKKAHADFERYCDEHERA